MKQTLQGCLVAPEDTILVFVATIRAGWLSGAVIVDDVRPLDVFDDLARVLLCLGRDIRVMHSGLVMDTDMMLRH